VYALLTLCTEYTVVSHWITVFTDRPTERVGERERELKNA